MLNEREARDEATFVKPDEEGTDADNRRRAPRFAVELDVTIQSEHNFYAGFAENLSAGGVFIATHQMKKVGEVIDVVINLPGIEQPVKGVGEVRWTREFSETSNVSPGLGLKFLSLEAGSLEAIQEFLANREPLFYDDDL